MDDVKCVKYMLDTYASSKNLQNMKKFSSFWFNKEKIIIITNEANAE